MYLSFRNRSPPLARRREAATEAALPSPGFAPGRSFEAIIDEELEPGDILYIPPGFPHEGYALENAMNYSVGFRAPNTRELISGFADYVLQRELAAPITATRISRRASILPTFCRRRWTSCVK